MTDTLLILSNTNISISELGEALKKISLEFGYDIYEVTEEYNYICDNK